MAHVSFMCAGDGIEFLGLVQGEHFRSSRVGLHGFDGLVLRPIEHDLSRDTTLFLQLCVFIFRGGSDARVLSGGRGKGAAGRGSSPSCSSTSSAATVSA